MSIARIIILGALSACCATGAYAVDGKAVIGGGLGGAAGAAVGSAVGGDTGAIVGAGVGAAAGAAIATHDDEPRTVVEKRIIHVHEDDHPGKHKGHHKQRNKHKHD